MHLPACNGALLHVQLKARLFSHSASLSSTSHFSLSLSLPPTLTDQQPPLNSVVDNIAIMDPTNPRLVVTWPTLSPAEGGDLVTSYNVRIIAQSLVSSNRARRRRRQSSGTIQDIPVPLGTNMITRPANPFTQYTNQVFANVPSGQVPLTAPNTVTTGKRE